MKTNKLIPVVLFLLSIIGMFSLGPSMAQQTTTVSINPSTTQLSASQVGSTINVNLTVSNVNNLGGWNLNLTWNPQVVNLTQITEGPFLMNAGSTLFTWGQDESPISRSEGYIQGVADILLSSTGVNGNGVLATISFHVLSVGTSTISIEGTTIVNPAPGAQNITATITNGKVIVGSGSNTSPSPTPKSSAPTSSTTPASTTSSTGSPTPTQSSTPSTPEFPPAIVLPAMLLAFAAVIILIKKTKINE